MKASTSQVFPRALLLDLDGTLIDSENMHVELVRQWMAESGIELREDEQNYVIGHAWQDIYQYLRVHERLRLDLSTFVQAMLTRKQELFHSGVELPVTEGAIELMDLAHQHQISMAIVSGSSRKEIAQAIALMNMDQKIHFYIGSEDYSQGKPAPDCYLLAAQKFGFAPAECLVIEDSEAGIQAALAAGMRVLATSFCNPVPGTSGYQDQSKADKIVSSLAKISSADLAALHKDA